MAMRFDYVLVALLGLFIVFACDDSGDERGGGTDADTDTDSDTDTDADADGPCSGECWSGCFNCVIGSETNLTAPCKTQADACWNNTDCETYANVCKAPCLEPYDQACVDQCGVQYPVGLQLWNAILQCADTTGGCTGCMPAR